MDLTCPECGSAAQLATGDAVYPGCPALWEKWFWVCAAFPACDCLVGCHPRSDEPLGTLADRATRRLRKDAHTAFDPLWKRGRAAGESDARLRAYQWLARQLGLSRDECHIGLMNADQCRRVIDVCRARARPA